jgi:hypothetical protein
MFMSPVASFRDSVDFNPGLGDSTITAFGEADVYVLKLDADGEFVWVRTLKGSGNSYGLSVAVDAESNIYCGGYFTGVVYFNSATGIDSLSSHLSSIDGFIQKLDENGNSLWIKNIGGEGMDWLHGIDVDSAGNVYSTGYFQGTVDFDPGLNTTNLSSDGLLTSYISKLNMNGEFVWARTFASNIGGHSNGSSVKVTESGNVLVLGDFTDTVDFDPGPGVQNLIATVPNPGFDNDSYVASLDASGNLNWVNGFDQFLFYQGSFITADKFDNIICTGYFEETLDFDPGSGVMNMTSDGNRDVFILKLNSNGEYLWSKRFGSTQLDEPTSVTVDDEDNIYTTGAFKGIVDFDPGPAIYELTNIGSGSKIFI